MSNSDKNNIKAPGYEREEGLLEKFLKTLVWIGTIFSFYIPWIIGNGGFFPFVGPKSLWFIFAAEIVFFAWLALAVINPKYRPKKNIVLGTLFIYILVVGISTITGVDPLRSFWSKFERMTGYLMILHCFMYFVALSSYFRTKKQWTVVLCISIFFSLIMGFTFLGFHYAEKQAQIIVSANAQIGQQELMNKLGWPWGDLYGNYVNGQNGLSLGNKSFMGTYLMFHVFFALYLLMLALFDKVKLGLEDIRNKDFWHQAIIWLCILSIAILAVVMKLANTRAMFYSFLGGLGLFAVFFVIKKVNKKVGIALLVAYAVIAIVLLAGIVDKDLFINKIYNIHDVFKNAGGSARLVIWQDVMPQVWKKPLFGWGPENFELAFYPIFDPKLFLQEYGGEVWFDRAHNVFIDNLISTGIIGLLAYLSLAAAAVWFLYKESKKENGNYWALATMAPLMAAYYIQNATVFDMVASFLVFYLSLAFIASLRDYADGDVLFKDLQINKAWGTLIVAVVFLLFGYTFVVRGFDANVGVIDVIFSYNAYDNMPTYCKLKNSKNLIAQMTTDQRNFLISFAPTADRLELVYGACDGKDYQYRNKYDLASFQKRQQYYKERVEAGRYGLYQNRDFLADIYVTNISQFDRLAVEQALKDKDPALMNSILQGIKGECDMWVAQLQDSTKTSPVDFRAYLKLGYTAGFCGRNLREASYLAVAEDALNKAKELSPHNPHSYWYMSQVLLFKGDKEGAGKWLKDALVLRDDLPQTYVYIIQFYNVIGDQKTALTFANQALAKYGENEKKNPIYASEWINNANEIKKLIGQIQGQGAAPVKK